MEAILKKKHRFRIMKLEERITPNLTLPSGHVIFPEFDNPSPVLSPFGEDLFVDQHPNFVRAEVAINATMGNPADGGGFGNEGPWSAHYRSPVIGCTEPGCV